MGIPTLPSRSMGETPFLPPLGHRFGNSGTGIAFRGGLRPESGRIGQKTNLNPTTGQTGLTGKPKVLDALFNRLIGWIRAFWSFKRSNVSTTLEKTGAIKDEWVKIKNGDMRGKGTQWRNNKTGEVRIGGSNPPGTIFT